MGGSKGEEASVDDSGLITQVEKYKKLVAFYEAATSMVVKADGDKDYVCTVKNKRKRTATRFVITMNSGAGEAADKVESDEPNIDFVPKANVTMLPEYARAHLAFEPNMFPVLMGDILQELYREDDDEEPEQDA
jgi:hypothetical protein